MEILTRELDVFQNELMVIVQIAIYYSYAAISIYYRYSYRAGTN